MGTTKTTLGKRIAHARAAAGFSQRGLAKHLGIDQSTVCRWEHNQAAPKLKRLDKLARLFAVDRVWLVMGEGCGPSEAKSAAVVS